MAYVFSAPDKDEDGSAEVSDYALAILLYALNIAQLLCSQHLPKKSKTTKAVKEKAATKPKASKGKAKTTAG